MSAEHDPLGTGPELEELVEQGVKEPRRFKVLMHNDDYTTMDFVVEVLSRVFHKTPAEAEAIMLAVHRQGIGVCGVYTAEVAETRIALVRKMAKARGFPLRCTLEEV